MCADGCGHRPFAFLNRLHVKFPQFAEKGQQGGLMQHDAEECWNALLMSLGRTVPRSDAAAGQGVHQENSIVSELFQGTTEARVRAETPVAGHCTMAI